MTILNYLVAEFMSMMEEHLYEQIMQTLERFQDANLSSQTAREHIAKEIISAQHK